MILPFKTVSHMDFVEDGNVNVEAVVTRSVTWDILLMPCHASDIVLDVFFGYNLCIN